MAENDCITQARFGISSGKDELIGSVDAFGPDQLLEELELGYLGSTGQIPESGMNSALAANCLYVTSEDGISFTRVTTVQGLRRGLKWGLTKSA